jgi:hypothetical protein
MANDHLVLWLRVAHVAVFAAAGIFAWSSYRIAKFSPAAATSPPSLVRHGLIAVVIVLLLGLLAHKCCSVKTKFGYLLGFNDYPKYVLY